MGSATHGSFKEWELFQHCLFQHCRKANLLPRVAVILEDIPISQHNVDCHSTPSVCNKASMFEVDGCPDSHGVMSPGDVFFIPVDD